MAEPGPEADNAEVDQIAAGGVGAPRGGYRVLRGYLARYIRAVSRGGLASGCGRPVALLDSGVLDTGTELEGDGVNAVSRYAHIDITPSSVVVGMTRFILSPDIDIADGLPS